MTNVDDYRVVFPEWHDERGEWEAHEKGWLHGVEVQFADGRAESVFFYDPTRLAQDLEAEIAQGRPCIAERGLIVIPEITRQAILAAVGHLVASDYFSEPHHAADRAAAS